MRTRCVCVLLLVCVAMANRAAADTAAGGTRHAVVIASDDNGVDVGRQ